LEGDIYHVWKMNGDEETNKMFFYIILVRKM